MLRSGRAAISRQGSRRSQPKGVPGAARTVLGQVRRDGWPSFCEVHRRFPLVGGVASLRLQHDRHLTLGRDPRSARGRVQGQAARFSWNIFPQRNFPGTFSRSASPRANGPKNPLASLSMIIAGLLSQFQVRRSSPGSGEGTATSARSFATAHEGSVRAWSYRLGSPYYYHCDCYVLSFMTLCYYYDYYYYYYYYYL